RVIDGDIGDLQTADLLSASMGVVPKYRREVGGVVVHVRVRLAFLEPSLSSAATDEEERLEQAGEVRCRPRRPQVGVLVFLDRDRSATEVHDLRARYLGLPGGLREMLRYPAHGAEVTVDGLHVPPIFRRNRWDLG